jgi:hypothetical protein
MPLPLKPILLETEPGGTSPLRTGYLETKTLDSKLVDNALIMREVLKKDNCDHIDALALMFLRDFEFELSQALKEDDEEAEPRDPKNPRTDELSGLSVPETLVGDTLEDERPLGSQLLLETNPLDTDALVPVEREVIGEEVSERIAAEPTAVDPKDSSDPEHM